MMAEPAEAQINKRKLDALKRGIHRIITPKQIYFRYKDLDRCLQQSGYENYCITIRKRGFLRGSKRTGGRAKAGSIAGSSGHHRGYRYIKIDGKLYASSRLAFLYMTGEWPQHFVDHIDRCRNNDKWDNLRPATRSQNTANRKGINRSGFKGVSWNIKNREWVAQIQVNGIKRRLGGFDNPSDAHARYIEAAREAFGEYACLESELKVAA
jgi:HNH endonuclease/AP2 domain